MSGALNFELGPFPTMWALGFRDKGFWVWVSGLRVYNSSFRVLWACALRSEVGGPDLVV